MDTSRIEKFAPAAKVRMTQEMAGRLDEVLAPDSRERLEHPAEVGALERAIEQDGRDAVVEKNAYSWFNRLCALRYMDANGFTPCGVVSPAPGQPASASPQLLTLAMEGTFPADLSIPPETRDRVRALLLGEVPSSAPTEDAYRLLLGAACDRYARPMGYLFGEQAASELLMPRGLLAADSVRQKAVEALDTEACANVEVLGWLYQFYVADDKDRIFKSKQKRGAREIPAATQLFTPDWICRYLVENSVGRLWMESEPESPLARSMDYYIAPEEGPGPTGAMPFGDPECLTVLDPCCGSGHMLVCAFDLLCAMYEEEGRLPEDCPELVLTHNLSGLEIDPRAAEICRFALEMKARERDPRWFDKGIDPDVNVLAPVRFTAAELRRVPQVAGLKGLVDAFAHLDEVGSLYVPAPDDLPAVKADLDELYRAHDVESRALAEKLGAMAEELEWLSRTYAVVVTNPPYMGSGDFEPWLKEWVNRHYPDAKRDLCTCFIERAATLAQTGGLVGLVTQHTWMFIGSFEALRKKFLRQRYLYTLVQLAPHGFINPAAQVAAFCFANRPEREADGPAVCIRLVDFDRPQLQGPKTREAIENPDCGWLYRADPESFKAIPGSPIAYWASEAMFDAFKNGTPFEQVGRPKAGITTGDNDRFVHLWWEVAFSSLRLDCDSISHVTDQSPWHPCNKGGDFRKWYGNREQVMAYGPTAQRTMAGLPGHRPVNLDIQFLPAVSWTGITSGPISFRYAPSGCLFDQKGMEACAGNPNALPLLGFLNSAVAASMLQILSPTLSSCVGEMARLPIANPDGDSHADALVQQNIDLAKADWDAFETSWDFQRHPLLPPRGEHALVGDRFARWEAVQQGRFSAMKANEEELNRIFAEAYSMEGEVPVEVEPDKVSVRRADPEREAKSLVSYAVGCVMGRYSVDVDGPVLADGGSKPADFSGKVPHPSVLVDGDSPIDRSGIAPVLAEQWFADDLAAEVERWLAGAFGPENLEANLAWLQRHLGKGLRAYLRKGFYEDHLRTYRKRPVYWMVSSPKGAFQALVYLHRYTPSTMGQVLSQYLRPYQEKLAARRDDLQAKRARGELSSAEGKELNRLLSDLEELDAWEKDLYKLAHRKVVLDLDDGVKVNYNKFPHVLKKVPSLSTWK